MAKSLLCGIAARNGVTAALLAQMGYDGPQSVFDGDYNFFRAFLGEKYDHEELIKNLGEKFTIVDTCFKLYSAGHPVHGPVDALIRILAREGITAEDIKSITVWLCEQAKGVVGDDPDMPELDIRYGLAVAAFDHQLTWDQYAPERLKDPKVAHLRSRVTAVLDPGLDEREKTTKSHSSELEIKTIDGRVFSERVDYPPGDPRNPASQEALDKKVMYYASKALGQRKTQRLIDTVKNLEALSEVNQLGDVLRTRTIR